MKMRIAARIVIAAFVVIFLAAGCKDGGPSSKVYVKSGVGKRIRVAVFPFDNVSKDQDAGRVVTNTVITYLLSTGEFDVVEPGVVSSIVGAEGIRLTDGITVEVAQKLQPKLNADAYIIGMVEEYGEVRIGPDTYPSISFSARLVDARNADILWAATISKTGADNVKVFDIGRVSSLGKLAKQAVAGMAMSLSNSRKDIMVDMGTSPPGPFPPDINKVNGVVKPEVTLLSAPGVQPGTATSTQTGSAKYLDESATYGEKELTALLRDVNTAKLGAVTYKKHFHETIETSYLIGPGKTVEVRLVDYLKTANSAKFIEHYNTGTQQTTFETVPAYTGESGFGYYHLDLAAGRFGVFLRGPKDNKADIEALGKGIIALLR